MHGVSITSSQPARDRPRTGCFGTRRRVSDIGRRLGLAGERPNDGRRGSGARHRGDRGSSLEPNNGSGARVPPRRLPFTGEPVQLFKTEHRFGAGGFGEKGGLVYFTVLDRDKRWQRTFVFHFDKHHAGFIKCLLRVPLELAQLADFRFQGGTLLLTSAAW